MSLADVTGTDQRIVMRGRHCITATCTLEISLYKCGERLYVSHLWIPDRPHWGEIDGILAPKIAAAISPYLRKAAQMEGFLRVVGEA